MTDSLYQRKQRHALNGKYSSWATTEAVVSHISIFEALFFLICIKDLSDDLTSNTKLFADDIPLFYMVKNMTESVNALTS